jgi:hypothetical protein
MEISPIPGIRALPAVKAQQKDFRPPAIFDIDASAKPGEGGGQRSSRKAAGAEEDDEDDLMVEGEMERGGEEFDEVQPRQVNYFA